MADFSRRFSDNDSCWLIKVDSRILGPFTFNEIVLKLTSSEFKPFHECISPMDRWRPLQSQPLFIAAVERLKKQKDDSSEFTFTKTERTSFTRTLDITSATPLPLNEQTPTFIPEPAGALGVESQKPNTTPAPRAVNVPPPVQNSQSMPRPHSFPWVLLGGIVVLVAVVIFLLMGRNQKEVSIPQADTKNQFLSLVDKGLEYKKIAEWSEALKYFRKAQSINSKDADLIFEVAPLYIQVENQAMLARSWLEKVMGAQYKRDNVVLGNNLIGLSYAYDNQYKMAIRYYDEALKNEESYLPALLNRGFAMMMSERYDEAEKMFSQSAQIQPNNAIAYIYLIENYIFSGLKNKNRTHFEKAYSMSQQIANRFFDGQQEFLFLQAYAALKLGKDSPSVIALLRNALQIDPDQTNEHMHSPILDWRGLQWSYFHQVCNDLSQLAKNDDHFFVKFMCAYKTNSEIQALQIAEGWAQKSPQNPMPQVAQAIVKYKLGDYEKARLSLDVAGQLGAQDKIYSQMAVKVCYKLKDSQCLSAYQNKIVHMAPLHSYLARSGNTNLSDSERKQAVYSGLRESSNYIPLLRQQ